MNSMQWIVADLDKRPPVNIFGARKNSSNRDEQTIEE